MKIKVVATLVTLLVVGSFVVGGAFASEDERIVIGVNNEVDAVIATMLSETTGWPIVTSPEREATSREGDEARGEPVPDGPLYDCVVVIGADNPDRWEEHTHRITHLVGATRYETNDVVLDAALGPAC